MNFRLTQIDELIREQHYYLEQDDDCYFFGEYTARQGPGFSEMNQLVWNLKKGNERRDHADYHYKGRAIERIARMIISTIDITGYTFVPVPPSKCAADPAYDDRMTAILRCCRELAPDVDYRELVVQSVSTTASHMTAEHRPAPDEIMSNYRLDHNLLAGCRSDIIILDDVLTAGSHFRAMKTFLAQYLPETGILGLFVARTTREADLTSLFEVQ
ncbi:hypothetical protein EC412_05335 [Salmonella enterica subsp. enterica serovar Redlands]|nr:hypothetical protein [Salmonella enterica subsp. enterica serovar Redlands]